MALLEAQGLIKSYGQVPVLRGVDLSLEAGTTLALLGSSGAGKSTLLLCLGTLERPDAGTLSYEGQDLTRIDGRAQHRFRNARLGFVFQFHHLLPEFTAAENVAMPGLIAGQPRRRALGRAAELMQELGLQGKETRYPGQLSGGEQQRVAVARALMNDPPLLLADEPTGNLDSANAEALFALLQQQAHKRGMALIVATHHQGLAQLADRRLYMQDGVLSHSPTT